LQPLRALKIEENVVVGLVFAAQKIDIGRLRVVALRKGRNGGNVLA
jgi:hypothetical protein